MHGPSCRPALAAALFLLADPVLAADPPEQLPAPRALPGQVISAPDHPAMPHPGYYRVNRRDVWQYYQVDRFGSWKPVVVWGPHGAYYLYNGQPYPWTSINNRWVIPTVQGTPYRSP